MVFSHSTFKFDNRDKDVKSPEMYIATPHLLLFLYGTLTYICMCISTLFPVYIQDSLCKCNSCNLVTHRKIIQVLSFAFALILQEASFIHYRSGADVVVYGGFVAVVANQRTSVEVVLCPRMHSSVLPVVMAYVALFTLPHFKSASTQVLQLVKHMHMTSVFFYRFVQGSGFP